MIKRWCLTELQLTYAQIGIAIFTSNPKLGITTPFNPLQWIPTAVNHPERIPTAFNHSERIPTEFNHPERIPTHSHNHLAIRPNANHPPGVPTTFTQSLELPNHGDKIPIDVSIPSIINQPVKLSATTNDSSAIQITFNHKPNKPNHFNQLPSIPTTTNPQLEMVSTSDSQGW